MKTNYSFGLYKSPSDDHDYLMASFLKDGILPDKYDITDKMTPVRSQGNEGACVGFATAVGVKEYMEQIDYCKFIHLSPRFLYEEAKKISGHSEGTTLKAAVEVAKNMGVCEERYWPYSPRNVGRPMSGANKNALRFRIKAYARVTNLKELQRSLVQYGALLVGVRVFKSIKKTGKNGIVPMPNRGFPSNWKSAGGHAICVVGYDSEKKLVKFKNSWGNWGQNGYGYLTYEYISKFMIDAFSMVDIDDPLPYNIRTVANLTAKERQTAWV